MFSLRAMAMRRVLGGLLRNTQQRAMVGASAHHHHEHYKCTAAKLIRPGPQWSRFCSTDAHAVSTYEEPIKTPAMVKDGGTLGALSNQEARKLLKLIKVDDFKKHLLSTGNHCMPLEEVLKLCKQTGTATTDAEAENVAKSLDEAGVILIFRKKVFLEPEKVAEILSRAMPLPLAEEDDPRNREFAWLQKEKDEIDRIAHRQVRNMLWGALGVFSVQSVLFFRLTFWDLSWDVMEPITFFVTSSSLLAGFFFFVITRRDPSYHDLMHTILSSKQRKLIKKRNFNLERFKELQVQCCLPSQHNRQNVSHGF